MFSVSIYSAEQQKLLLSCSMCFFVLLLQIIILVIIYFRVQAYQCRKIYQQKQQTQNEQKLENVSNKTKTKKKKTTIAFFHPYCSSGGGGERVLWKMIEVLYNYHTKAGGSNKSGIGTIIIYTIDKPTPHYKENLLNDVQQRFNFRISQDKQQQKNDDNDDDTDFHLLFIHLSHYKYLLQPSSILSLLMESIGLMRLAYYALQLSRIQYSIVPDIFIDTMGCSFTYLPAYILYNCIVIPYIHYPTISMDMLQVVYDRRPISTYNHNTFISQSFIKTYIKLFYYIVFAILYGCIGSFCCTIIYVNSTWTYNHICSLWYFCKKKSIHIVYPPCNVSDFSSSSLNETTTTATKEQQQQCVERIPSIVSIGQFRPEKDHILQLQSFAKLLELYPTYFCQQRQQQQQGSSDTPQTTNKNDNDNSTTTKLPIQLVLIGSCRGIEDEKRLQSLKDLTIQLNIQNSVQFIVNQPYSTIQYWLRTGTIGIHTMWNEHFGIGIVEMMAGGLLTIAHKSGGPKLDIIQENVTGYLATTCTEYAQCIHTAFQMSNSDQQRMRNNAKQSCNRFSDNEFTNQFEKLFIRQLKL